MFGRSFLPDGMEILTNSSEDQTNNWTKIQKEKNLHLHPVIKEKIAEYRDYYRKKFDEKVKIQDPLQVGDMVSIRNNEKKDKLSKNWLGPLIVDKVTAHGQYLVKTLQGESHATKLNHNDVKKVPYIIVDDNYEVQKILKHRWTKNMKCWEFFTKWLDFSARHNSWVKLANFGKGSILKKYIKANKIKIDQGKSNSK